MAENKNIEVRVQFVTDTKGLDELKNATKELQNNTAVDTAAKNTEQVEKSASKAAENVQNVNQALQTTADTSQQAAAQTDNLQQTLQSTASAAEQLVDAMAGQAPEFLVESADAAKDLGNAIVNLDAEELKEKLEDVSSTATALSVGLSGISAGLIGIGSYAVTVSGEFEQLKAKLITVQKSADEATATFEYANKLAASTPFDVKGVTAAAVQLEVYGQSARKLLPQVANLAAGMGQDVTAAATAIGKTLSGSRDGLQMLRDSFGLTTDKIKAFGAATNKQGEIAMETRDDLEKLKAAIVGVIDNDFAGGIERQADTVAGALGNLEDEVTNTAGKIGDELAPYVKLVATHVADLVGQAGNMAPILATVGTLTAGVAGLGGAAIGAIPAVTSMMAAYDKLTTSVSNSKAVFSAWNNQLTQIATSAGLSAEKLNALKFAGSAIGVAAAVGMAAELAIERYEAQQKALDQKVTEDSKVFVKMRNDWNSLRLAIEGATGATVGFNGSKVNTSVLEAIANSKASTQAIADALSAKGFDKNKREKLNDALSNQIEKENEKLAAAWEKRQRLSDAIKSYRDAGYVNPSAEAESALGYSYEDAEREISAQESVISKLQAQQSALAAIVTKIDDANKPLQSALNSAKSLGNYLKFADATKDLTVLKSALNDVSGNLKNLRDQAMNMYGYSSQDLTDNSKLVGNMKKLLDAGKGDSTQFTVLQTIFEQSQQYAKRLEAITQLEQQEIQKRLQAQDKAFAEQQAGRDRDLQAEREHIAAKLKVAEDARKSSLTSVSSELKIGGTDLERLQYLQDRQKELNHLSKEEISLKNQLRDINKALSDEAKNNALKSLNSSIGELKSNADELASALTSDSAQVISAYDVVLRKAKAWAQANSAIISQSTDVKKAYENIVKSTERSRNQALKSQSAEYVNELRNSASERMNSVSSPYKQLEAVQANVRMYQQALRNSQELQQSEAARLQVQNQLNALKRQELSLQKQVKQLETQAANETQSIEIQLEQEKLAMLEQKAANGEKNRSAILAQEQKIYELQLKQLQDAEAQKLEEVKDSETAKLEVVKQFQMKRELLEAQLQRRQYARDKTETKKAKTKELQDKKNDKAATSWKPGSPLMTMQEALSKHNQWFAEAGNDTNFKSSVDTTTSSVATLGKQAADAAGSLASLASSAAASANAGGARASMPTPNAMGATPSPQVELGTTAVTYSSNGTTNNYYIDGVRASQSMDTKAIAREVSKVADQTARRQRTYMGQQ